SVSASRRIETPFWSRKPAWLRQSSGLTPITTQLHLENSSSWSEKSVASRVQPGVPSLGEKNRTTCFFPRNCSRSTVSMSASGSENGGAACPACSASGGRSPEPNDASVARVKVSSTGVRSSTDYNRRDENATAGWTDRNTILVTILAAKTASRAQR